MELVITIIVIGLIGYWAYTNFNKQKANEAHPLDQFTKPIETAPYKVPEPPAVTPIPLIVDGHGDVHEVAPVKPAPKAKRAPAVKKPAAPRAPAKPRAKKAPKQ
jgi:hypothetical protein